MSTAGKQRWLARKQEQLNTQSTRAPGGASSTPTSGVGSNVHAPGKLARHDRVAPVRAPIVVSSLATRLNDYRKGWTTVTLEGVVRALGSSEDKVIAACAEAYVHTFRLSGTTWVNGRLPRGQEAKRRGQPLFKDDD